MNESVGITVQNQCYECMVIERDRQEGFLPMQCQSCIDSAEAKADDNAWNLHEDDRLGESGNCLTYDTSAEPSASDWVASVTYIKPASRRAQMIEQWDENLKLIQLAVEFIDNDEPTTRSEFLPPIAQLMDGGVYEELWELQDERQRAREVQCHWCNLLTPKAFNDCQACDQPLELNVR